MSTNSTINQQSTHVVSHNTTLSTSQSNAAVPKGLLNGHSFKKMGIATLVGTAGMLIPLSFIHCLMKNYMNLIKFKTSYSEELIFLASGALMGMTANILHKEIENRLSISKDYKKISLITAGLISAMIGSEVLVLQNNQVDQQIIPPLVTMFAPIGIAAAWAGQ